MMKTATQRFSVSPRVGALVTQMTQTPDIETALFKVLHEYLELKIEQNTQQIQTFETKWGMTFKEFAERIETETLEQDSYSYDVESDFWEWEEAETLLHHYTALQTQWM